MNKKRIKILIIIFIILLFPIFLNTGKENTIQDLNFKQVEDKKTPIGYKKEYTFIIKELSDKNNTLEFNSINHYVEVYINDNLLYELKEQNKVNTLIKIPLNKKYINKKVKIILTPLNDKNINNDLNLEIK